jgi:putative acetyltransferase
MGAFRTARADDIPAMAAIIADTFDEHGWDFVMEDELPDFIDYPSAYAHTPNRLYAMTDDAGTVIGSIALKLGDDGAYLSRVYLARAERGRGLGKVMVRFILDLARENGHRHVHLWTDTRFMTAHGLYERMGFHRQPVIRSLHDTNNSFEFRYDLDLVPGK